MDRDGNLYLGEDVSEEDQRRAEDWGKEIERQEEEIQKKLKEIERQEVTV